MQMVSPGKKRRMTGRMGELSAKVDRLSKDLRALRDAPATTQFEINRMRDRVADLLLRALSDEQHPLSTGLAELEARVDLEKAGTLYRKRKPRAASDENVAADEISPKHEESSVAVPSSKVRNPFRHLFMPHPLASDAEARRLWRLQLLLQTAARSPAHSGRLAERLLLSKKSMRQAADEAAQASSVAFWSPGEYLQRLEEAVEALDHADRPISFRLEGREFIHQDGKLIKLSNQEAKFLQMLVEHAGKPVTHTAFNMSGISYPVQVRNRLENRLKGCGIDLRLDVAVKAYTLPTAGA